MIESEGSQSYNSISLAKARISPPKTGDQRLAAVGLLSGLSEGDIGFSRIITRQPTRAGDRRDSEVRTLYVCAGTTRVARMVPLSGIGLLLASSSESS